MAISFFSASIITGCVLNNIEVRARLGSISVLGRGWDGGVFSRKCVGWSFTTSIFNDLWDTNMTKRAAERSRWWDQRDEGNRTPSYSHSHAAFYNFSLVKNTLICVFSTLLHCGCMFFLAIFNL